MGAGIAALAAEASLHTLLYDPDSEALARAPEGVQPVRDLKALAPCGLVIEAAPEDLELKRALFARLAEVVEPDCVLATNTSSLSVTGWPPASPTPGASSACTSSTRRPRCGWSRWWRARPRARTRWPSRARPERRWAST
jgi:3-hydroxyacyl-CoA dehydrogenase